MGEAAWTIQLWMRGSSVWDRSICHGWIIKIRAFDTLRLGNVLFYVAKLTDALTWYATKFKDPLVVNPEPWFQCFLYCEGFLQLFFFPVAAYAFWKGNCKWIRTPVIIYATHVTTTVVACLAHILFTDFSIAKVPSPQTLQERLTLSAFYAPFLAISLAMLLFVLFSSAYKPVEKKKKK